MKNLTLIERKSRIIARGEFSNHSHVITGDCEVETVKGKIIIHVNDDQNACLKHLLETEWLNGKEVWTKEHKDISLKGFPKQVRHGDVLLNKCGERDYEFIQQQVFDTLTKRIESARD